MWLGLISILLAWIMFGYVFLKMRHLKRPTLSTLAASDKKTYLVFAVCLTLSGILIYIFLLNWFIGALGLSRLFTVIASVAIFLQIITAWVPDTKGWKHIVHHNTAWAEAWLLLPMAIMISASSALNAITQIICSLFILIMLGLALFTYRIHDQPEFVYSQGAYIMCFHIVVLVATFYVAFA